MQRGVAAHSRHRAVAKMHRLQPTSIGLQLKSAGCKRDARGCRRDAQGCWRDARGCGQVAGGRPTASRDGASSYRVSGVPPSRYATPRSPLTWLGRVGAGWVWVWGRLGQGPGLVLGFRIGVGAQGSKGLSARRSELTSSNHSAAAALYRGGPASHCAAAALRPPVLLSWRSGRSRVGE